ncbi:hypothetical protein R1flu_006003 [Riccia fluitans]|uniref:C3H1-type domain-containing protein n=1 Tax=Riccia fluitans TaxID=41844 RepID=A0ABD1YXJ6_9MARC
MNRSSPPLMARWSFPIVSVCSSRRSQYLDDWHGQHSSITSQRFDECTKLNARQEGMDTTAAAELGGVSEGGVGYWDGVGEPRAGLNDRGTAGQPAPSSGEGGGAGGHGRGNRSASENEPPPKRMRNMAGGDGPPYGSGSLPSNNNVSGSTSGLGGNGGGSGPGAGGSPNLKNYGSGGLGPSPGTPNTDSPGHGQGGGSRGRGMGSIFYKTKLCSRFRNGNCPYNTNCNFAHGMDELRKPPPGWEDVVAGPEGGAPAAPPAASQLSVQGSGGINGERNGSGVGGRGSGAEVAVGVAGLATYGLQTGELGYATNGKRLETVHSAINATLHTVQQNYRGTVEVHLIPLLKREHWIPDSLMTKKTGIIPQRKLPSPVNSRSEIRILITMVTGEVNYTRTNGLPRQSERVRGEEAIVRRRS